MTAGGPRSGDPGGEPVGWSPSRLDTLAALAAAFAPGFEADDYRRMARSAADTLNAVADPDDLRQLKLVVSALDSPLANLLTGGGWRRIGRLSGSDADRLLLGWAASRIGQRRTAFQAFKRLLLFTAWTDLGGDGTGNPAWTELGYEPPGTVTSPPPSITPLTVDRDSDTPICLEADVVVVGSGAGGGVVAARLAAAGRSVLVVEAGSYLPEAEMPTLEGEAFRRLYLDRGTTATADLAVTIVAGAGLGGGTTVNWTTCIDPPDWLRAEWAVEHGLAGFDGAQTDADVARLHAELDLQPPSITPAKDQLIHDGGDALGWEHETTRRNAGPCTECGACGFGCRTGAKRSGLRAHLAAAHRAGARILVDAPVERVDVAGTAVSGVSGRLRRADGGWGPSFRVQASQVVLAAGALRTPLLLMASGVRHPELGANLHLHPAVVITAVMPHRVEAWRGPLQAARSLEFSRPGPPSADGVAPAHGGFFIETGPVHPGLAASALPWEGGAQGRAFMREFPSIVPLGGALRDRTAGRVFWSRSGRPRIEYRLSAADRQSQARIMYEVSRMARAGGAVELLAGGIPADRIDLRRASDAQWAAFLRRRATADYGPNRMLVFSAHQMGTARAGSNARAAVCDPHGRVRSAADQAPVPGLYVADASLFPTAAGVNPMVTIMALAERTARAVLADR